MLKQLFELAERLLTMTRDIRGKASASGGRGRRLFGS